MRSNPEADLKLTMDELQEIAQRYGVTAEVVENIIRDAGNCELPFSRDGIRNTWEDMESGLGDDPNERTDGVRAFLCWLSS